MSRRATIRLVPRPAGQSLTPALDVFARIAGHHDFAALVATSQAAAREQQAEPIGCPS